MSCDVTIYYIKSWPHYGYMTMIPTIGIARRLGAEKCEALFGFPAITSCDNISTIYGRSKTHAWDVWSKFRPVTVLRHFVSYSYLYLR